ncbi:hypothetical protein [Clostridium estertheticum]|uniref:hypothetical protein n=1 Tax=Clostridium estertheticum TaxID=238834 RepID=UPI001C0A9EDC|nr:hypothetical protein [Clostridium estertheticum]MBU3073869.1 hypothetical protein [Clostridium estertheticum]MBU3163964.1 hypothetical protein [Clostridium estertheticum]
MCGINKMDYEISHTENYLNKMDSVISWLSDKGFRANCSRYSKYKKYLNDFYNEGNINDLDDLAKRFEKANTALQECIQIIQVYNAFKDEDGKGFNERLKNVVSGIDFYNSDNKADQPRDFLYELLTAVRFKDLGYAIDFEHITDVVAIRNDITLYVECKRIKSINGLEENIRKACKQLSRVEDSKEYYRIIFIDIYNCLADKIKDYEYSNLLCMRYQLNTILENEFILKNTGLIEKILTKNLSNTLGVAFTATRCLWLSNMTPQYYQDCKVLTSSKIAEVDLKLLNEMLQ